jgi:hypothetical protein
LEYKTISLMKNIWTIWKHALGSYSEQDGYDPTNDDIVGMIRTGILLVNIICAFFIVANVVHNW